MPRLLYCDPAVVTAQDPDNYGVYVSLQGTPGGQGPTLPVKVLTQGPRDAVRGHYPELPTPGTWGLVVYARGDPRGGHWIGATDPCLMDASAHAPGLGNLAYRAAFDGSWYWHGGDGVQAAQWPDGSSLVWSPSGTTLPAPTRHTLDASGARQRTNYTMNQRIASGSASRAFAGVFSHASSASVGLTAAGSWQMQAAPSQNLVFVVSGGTNITVSGDTSMVIAQPGTGTSVLIGANGAIQITLAGGQVMTVTRQGGGTAKQVKLADNTNSSVLLAIN